MTGLAHLDRLEEQVEAMANAIASTDPSSAVPACPGWTVRDLTGHLIAVHSWVTATLGNPAPADYAEQPLEGGADELAVRYRDAGQALVSRLRELPADTPSWSFDKSDQTAGYWHRRQLHEVTVHRWDVEPHAIDDDIAADGVDEAVDFFIGRQVARGRVTLPDGSLRLVGTSRTWVLGEGDPEHTVDAPTGDLLLALWGRNELLPTPWCDARLLP